MKRTLSILLSLVAAGAWSQPADDVGNTPAEAELASTGSVTRSIEWIADRDVFQFTALPYVSNVLVVTTGTIWDCEMDLLAPSGAVVVHYTNTAAGLPAPVTLVSTTAAVRAYVRIRGLAEYTTGTYQFARTPTFTDTDGDGLPDAWEMSRFGVLTNGPSGDADEDGASNRDEYLAGSDPASAASALAITALRVVSNWTHVTWQTQPEGLYRVSVSAVATGGAWETLADNLMATSLLTTVIGVPASEAASYRVELQY
jgi:hypothetical protein